MPQEVFHFAHAIPRNTFKHNVLRREVLQLKSAKNATKTHKNVANCSRLRDNHGVQAKQKKGKRKAAGPRLIALRMEIGEYERIALAAERACRSIPGEVLARVRGQGCERCGGGR